MAITRTQIARQLYKRGTGLGGAGRGRQDAESQYGAGSVGSYSSSGRNGGDRGRDTDFQQRGMSKTDYKRAISRGDIGQNFDARPNLLKTFQNKAQTIGLKNLIDQKRGLKNPAFGLISILNRKPTLKVYEDDDENSLMDTEYGMTGKNLTDISRAIGALDKSQTVGITRDEYLDAFFGPDNPQDPRNQRKEGDGPVPYWAQLGFNSEAEYLASLGAQAPSTTEQEPKIEEPFQLARRFRADGGRAGFQEGGIMPRLNQLGSGVSSAEQTLQDINQRLESAESSLGGGGGNQFSQVTLPETLIQASQRPVPESMQSKPQNFEPLQQADPNSPLLGVFQSRPENTTGSIAQIPASGGVNLAGIPAASYADGGNVVGGEFDFESARQMYGLGKLVKKVTRTVKKIAKSPIGKAAIAAASLYYMPKFGIKAQGGLAPFLQGAKTSIGNFFLGMPGDMGGRVAGTGLLSKIPGGGVTAAIAGTSLLAGLLTPEQEEEAEELSRGEGIDIEAARRSILERAQGNIAGDLRARRFRAEGGSMKEPVAKKTMPLLDMDGQEMDLRAEGGFVPIGRMEKADDVPARLSKNEFVFTADAVRNAGDGNVDKGAEVMYNMMKNLEAGGEVSEESQGLEGARKMFQTSQRLEEVL